jgi:nucleoside-diphosphate-sugar epimerase
MEVFQTTEGVDMQNQIPVAVASKQKTMLIIGATGGVGKAVAEAVAAHGWHVKALTRHRDPTALGHVPGVNIEWRQGDAMQADDVLRAAQGVDCILHAANPPKYSRWRELAMPMLDNAIAAAKSSGARLILPGNIYNFGNDAGTLISESSPQHPPTRKGKVRVEMEQMMQEAAQQGARMMVVRAGDFFGGHSPSSWFSTVMIKPGKPVKAVNFMGDKDVGHSWAYLPDLAETIARLASVEDKLGNFEVFHFSGQWTPRAIDMAEAIRRASGNPKATIRSFPWPLLYLASPFVELFRELLEMRYLWKVPMRLDNRKLVSVLGEEPHTDLDQAVRNSLRQLACI